MYFYVISLVGENTMFVSYSLVLSVYHSYSVFLKTNLLFTIVTMLVIIPCGDGILFAARYCYVCAVYSSGLVSRVCG